MHLVGILRDNSNHLSHQPQIKGWPIVSLTQTESALGVFTERGILTTEDYLELLDRRDPAVESIADEIKQSGFFDPRLVLRETAIDLVYDERPLVTEIPELGSKYYSMLQETQVKFKG